MTPLPRLSGQPVGRSAMNRVRLAKHLQQSRQRQADQHQADQRRHILHQIEMADLFLARHQLAEAAPLIFAHKGVVWD